MRIIFEGPDGSGKSSIAKQVGLDLNIPTFWSAGPPGNLANVKKCCIEQLNMRNTIFDRVTCISEQCYNMNLSFIRKQLLNNYLIKMMVDSVIVYCTALVPESEDGLRNKEHDKMVQDNFKEIKLRYKNIMLNVNHIKYNFQTMKYEDLLCKIKCLIEKEKI